MKKNLILLLMSILFGLLGTLSLAPFNVPVIAWFVPWTLFYMADSLKRAPLFKILFFSFLTTLFACIFAFHWIIHLFVEYGGIPFLLAVTLFIPYSFLLNSKIPFIIIFLAKIKPKFRFFSYYIFLGVPVIITLIDILTPQVFNWYLGNLVTKNFYFSQIADVTGIHGITFLYIFFSYFFYRTFLVIRRNPKFLFYRKFIKTFLLFIVLYVAIYAYGAWQIRYVDTLLSSSQKVRVALIQPDAPLEKYGENKVTEEVLVKLMMETIPGLIHESIKKGEGKVDLVILPESAVPYFTTQRDFLTLRLQVFHPFFAYLILHTNKNYNVDVFFNEIRYELEGMRIKAYNSSTLSSRTGNIEAIYHKRKLIAFGEQIPLAEFLDRTGLIALIPESIRYSRFEPGKEFVPVPYSTRNYHNPFLPEKTFTFPLSYEKELFQDTGNSTWQIAGYFMPLICYEIIQPEYVRSFFQNSKYPVDFLVNVTQDKWYGKTIQSYQHLELARIRSIELRRSIVRSTNSGVSTSIDPAGRYITPVYGQTFTGQETKEIQIVDIPVIKDVETIYAKIGLFWLYGIVFLYAVLSMRKYFK